MSTTARLAQWIAAAPKLEAGMARDRAKLSFIDTIACMIAGAGEPPVQAVSVACSGWGKGDCRVAGLGDRLSPPWAALVGGTAAHAIDFDDNLEPALGHASAVLVPTLLSLASDPRVTGAALLDGYVVGLEAFGRLGLMMNMDHYKSGWHATVTLGAPAAAAAVSRVWGLNAETASHAISIATSMAGGSKIQFGTGLKPVHAGLAAKAGIVAAGLAAAGLNAAPEAIDGPWGLHGLMHGRPNTRWSADDTEPLIIERYDLMRKIYPCCAAMHRAIDGILDLEAEHGLDWRRVEAVDVLLAEIQTQNLLYPEPETPGEARFSLHYCIASALVDQQLGPAAFSQAAVERPVVRSLARRIRMTTDPALPGTLPPDAETPTMIRITLQDGTVIERCVRYQRGHEQRPLALVDLKTKFEVLTEGPLGTARASRLWQVLERFEEVSDVMALIELTLPEAPGGQ